MTAVGWTAGGAGVTVAGLRVTGSGSRPRCGRTGRGGRPIGADWGPGRQPTRSPRVGRTRGERFDCPVGGEAGVSYHYGKSSSFLVPPTSPAGRGRHQACGAGVLTPRRRGVPTPPSRRPILRPDGTHHGQAPPEPPRD